MPQVIFLAEFDQERINKHLQGGEDENDYLVYSAGGKWHIVRKKDPNEPQETIVVDQSLEHDLLEIRQSTDNEENVRKITQIIEIARKRVKGKNIINEFFTTEARYKKDILQIRYRVVKHPKSTTIEAFDGGTQNLTLTSEQAIVFNEYIRPYIDLSRKILPPLPAEEESLEDLANRLLTWMNSAVFWRQLALCKEIIVDHGQLTQFISANARPEDQQAWEVLAKTVYEAISTVKTSIRGWFRPSYELMGGLQEQTSANLAGLLITPAQRVPRYRLLLETLLKSDALNQEQTEQIRRLYDDIGENLADVNEATGDLSRSLESVSAKTIRKHLFEPASRLIIRQHIKPLRQQLPNLERELLTLNEIDPRYYHSHTKNQIELRARRKIWLENKIFYLKKARPQLQALIRELQHSQSFAETMSIIYRARTDPIRSGVSPILTDYEAGIKNALCLTVMSKEDFAIHKPRLAPDSYVLTKRSYALYYFESEAALNQNPIQGEAFVIVDNILKFVATDVNNGPLITLTAEEQAKVVLWQKDANGKITQAGNGELFRSIINRGICTDRSGKLLRETYQLHYKNSQSQIFKKDFIPQLEAAIRTFPPHKTLQQISSSELDKHAAKEIIASSCRNIVATHIEFERTYDFVERNLVQEARKLKELLQEKQVDLRQALAANQSARWFKHSDQWTANVNSKIAALERMDKELADFLSLPKKSFIYFFKIIADGKTALNTNTKRWFEFTLPELEWLKKTERTLTRNQHWEIKLQEQFRFLVPHEGAEITLKPRRPTVAAAAPSSIPPPQNRASSSKPQNRVLKKELSHTPILRDSPLNSNHPRPTDETDEARSKITRERVISRSL